MRSVRVCLVLLLLVAGHSPERTHSAPAEKSPAKEGKGGAGGKSVSWVEATLEDESVIRLVLLDDHFRIQTPYGPLKVPVADIEAMQLRLRPGLAAEKRIRSAVTDLSADVFDKREAGKKALLELGPASYHAVVEATRSDDLEVAKRAKDVQAKLEAEFPQSLLQREPYDIIQTPMFRIVGQVDATFLKVRTAHFGEAQLKLESLRDLRMANGARAATVEVDAARYSDLRGTAWLETKIEVRARTHLQIKATGEVNLWPQGGRMAIYLARPIGSNQGMLEGFASGALVGRVGEKGRTFLIGESYDGIPEGQGKLYLRIISNPWGNTNEGKYTVTISTR
jgi:hypothetical protein